MSRSSGLSARDGCAEKLKILADPTRLAVIQILMEGPRRVGELNARLGVEQSLLSHHLRVLRDAGVVRAERDGKAVVYRLDPDVATPRASKRSIDLGCCSLAFNPRPRP